MSSADANLAGKKVLVTGATGFIGGRLVERLSLEYGANVRALVRNFSKAPRIARFPIEMIAGDITDPDAVERATQGCNLVFHCAYGNLGAEEDRKNVNVAGTRNVLDAALRHRIQRVIFVSTMMVYGIAKDGDLDETAPRPYTGSSYGDSKIDAENLAFEYVRRHDLPITILQPTTVYGPSAQYSTVLVLASLKNGKVLLINDGEGVCNPVYVDDVVNAMFLAASRKEAVGEAFLISGEVSSTWREYYGSYERMLGVNSTISMSAGEALVYYKRKQKRPHLFSMGFDLLRNDDSVRERMLSTVELDLALKVVKSVVPNGLWQRIKGNPRLDAHSSLQSRKPEPAVPAWSPFMINFYAAKARVRIDKAKRILGYTPMFDLAGGMKLTEQWARWANLLG